MTEVVGTSGSGGGVASATDSAGVTGAPEGSTGETTAVPTTGGPTSSGSSGGGETSTGGTGSSGASSTGAVAVCGDGELDDGEACDDGNVLADDGCSPLCEVGPGAALGAVVVPVGKLEHFAGLAVVGKQHLGGDSHGLTLAGEVSKVGPQGQVAAHVQQRSAQDGALRWAYLEYAEVFGRRAFQVVAAANGDVVVAGQIYTEQMKPDSGGRMWLARFSPAGDLVWSVEPEMTPWISTREMVMNSAGDVVLVGIDGGLGGVWSQALRIRGADGATLWKYSEPEAAEDYTYYEGVAVDAADDVYIVGTRWSKGELLGRRLLVRALDRDGAERWAFELGAAPKASLDGTSISVTTDAQLFVVGVAVEGSEGPSTLVMTGVGLDGKPLWSEEWSPPAPTVFDLGEGVAAPDGGVYLVGGYGPEEARKGITAHFDAAGLPVWVNPGGSGPGIDLAVDPDGVLQVLIEGAVVAYAP